MQLTPEQQRLSYRWLVVLVLIGLVCRLVRFGLGMPIWGDEAMLGLNIVGRSYRELLAPLDSGQVSPPGFLWSLRFVFDCVGISDYTSRLPALAAGMLALLIFWQWARVLVARHAATIGTGILAVSNYAVRHGVELKPYAFDLLAAVLLLWLGSRCLISRSKLWLVGLIAAAPACAAISYPQVFVSAAIGIALLLHWPNETRSQRRFVVIYCLVGAASFVVMWRWFGAAQFQASSSALQDYWHAAFPPRNPIKFLPWFLQVNTGNLFAYPLGGKDGASAITFVLFCVGLRSCWSNWSAPVRLLLLSPFVFTFIAAALRLYPYGESARVSQHLAPIIILTAGAGVAHLVDRAATPAAWRTRFSAVCSLLLGIGTAVVVTNLVWPYKTKADAQLRSDVRALLTAAGNDPIFALQPISNLPPTLRWYLLQAPNGVTGPPADLNIPIHGSAYIVNCDRNQNGLETKLAAQTHSHATVMSRHDLQLGPRENGPDRIEIIRLTH